MLVEPVPASGVHGRPRTVRTYLQPTLIARAMELTEQAWPPHVKFKQPQNTLLSWHAITVCINDNVGKNMTIRSLCRKASISWKKGTKNSVETYPSWVKVSIWIRRYKFWLTSDLYGLSSRYLEESGHWQLFEFLKCGSQVDVKIANEQRRNVALLGTLNQKARELRTH